MPDDVTTTLRPSTTTAKPKPTTTPYQPDLPRDNEPPTPVSNIGSRVSLDEVRSILNFHNTVRDKHSAPPVEWDDGLAKIAQKFIETCPVGHSDTPYGESIAWGQDDFDEAMQNWYDEDFNFDVPTLEDDAGHFTQMIWSDTKRIGCAKNMACRVLGTEHAFTCYYDPPGNTLGVDWKDKVKRPK